MTTQPKWFESVGEMNEVVVSTRIRLARNMADIPFNDRMSGDDYRQVIRRLRTALADESGQLMEGMREVSMETVSRNRAMAMVERHLISKEFACARNLRSLFMVPDESLSVMAGEEDHIRIQSMRSGLALRGTMTAAFRLDDVLDGAEIGTCLSDSMQRESLPGDEFVPPERTNANPSTERPPADSDDSLSAEGMSCGEKLTYAFDEHLGYLTRCPTNLGTGMRASVMLHLPALTAVHAMKQIIVNAQRLGLAVRGMYGEGSEAVGNFYQFSNQVTLGLSEEETLQKLKSVVVKVAQQEISIRERMLETAQMQVSNRIWRAYGILRNARLMGAQEFMTMISDVRFGVAARILDKPSLTGIDKLVMFAQPGSVCTAAGRELNMQEIEEERAALVRSAMDGNPNPVN